MELSRKNLITILFLIVVLGSILRLYQLGADSFVADEFLDINSSYAYFKTGQWQNWDFNFSRVNAENAFIARDERAWPYKWQVAELFNYLSPSEGNVRLVSVFWGIVSIILMYLTGAYFTKKKWIGLLSAFLFAVSIGGIELDRKLRMYAMFLPIYLLFSWLLFRFLEEKYDGRIGFLKSVSQKWGLNFLYLIPAAVAGIISLLVHDLTANIVAVIAVYLIFWAIVSYRKNGYFLNKYSMLLGLGIAGVLSILILASGKIAPYMAGIQFFKTHFSYFGIAFSDYNNIILSILLMGIGIYYLFQNKNLSRETAWLIMSFFVPLLSAIFLWNRLVGDQYIFFIKSFGIIIVASGIYFSAQFFQKNMADYKIKSFWGTLMLALLILPNYGYFFEDNNTYRQNSSSNNPNYRSVFNYFNKNKKDGDVLITRNFRNYYFAGAKIPVIDFGGELNKQKMSLVQVQDIYNSNLSGWAIISDNDEDYISNDALSFMEKNFQKISNPQVRGQITVFRWSN